MPNVLEVQIIGDIQGLDKSLKAAEKLQAEYTASIEKTSKELAENIIISNNYKKAVAELSSEFKKGNISQQEYDKGLQNLKRDEKETTVVTANLRKELSNLKREQKEIAIAFGNGATGVTNLGKAGANATPTLIELGRVVQDAPYGIQGVANNITQLVTQFGYLQKSSGSTSGALKSLAGSFLGSGGFIFAISIATSLLVEYGDEIFKVEDATHGLTDATKEGIGQARAEISTIEALISVLQDEDSSRQAKLNAYKKINELQPSILQGLTFEQAQTTNLTERVNQLTEALIRQAKVKGLQDLLSEKYAEIAKNAQQAGKATASTTDYIQAFFKSASLGFADFGNQLQLEGLKTAGDNISELNKEAKDFEKQLREIISTDAGKTISTFFEDEKKTGKTKKTKAPNVTPQVTGLDSQLKAQDLVDVGSIAVVTGQVDEFGNKIKGLAEITVPQIKLRPLETSEYLDSIERARNQTLVFSDAISSSIGALAGQLSSSLETGNAVIDAFVGSLVQSLAQITASLIQTALLESIIGKTREATAATTAQTQGVLIATSAATALGPAGVLALPGLLAATAGTITGALAVAQVPKFAHGGIVPGGSFTGDKIPAMLNSGETVMNRQQQANVLMAIANGNSNSLQNNRIIDDFDITSVLRGNDIWLSVKRTEKKR